MATATAPKAEKLKPAPTPDEIKNAPAPRVVLIPILDIEFDKNNPRLEECESEEAINALADDLNMRGMMQPVGVRQIVPESTKTQNQYRLVWGSRRVAAAITAGWDAVPAVVTTMDDAQAAEAQAAENLHRLPMNPLEELLAVERYIKLLGPKPDAEAVEIVAKRFGKSTKWVRDRRYFSRLSQRVRDMLADGTCSIAAARELAKVVDHREQDNLVRIHWRGGPPDMDYLAEECNGRANSLHQVAWKLDAAGVAEGTPVCTACPHNSANDPQLFGDEKELGKAEWEGNKRVFAKGPFCSKASCYEKKQKAAEAGLQQAGKAAAAAFKKAPAKGAQKVDAAEAVEIAVEQFGEKFTAEAIKTVAKDALSPKKAAKSETSDRPAYDSPEYKKRERERDAKRKAAEAARRKATLALKERLVAVPGARLTLFVMETMAHESKVKLFGSLSSWDGRKRNAAQPTAAMMALLTKGLSGTVTIADLEGLFTKEFDADYAGDATTIARLLKSVGKHGRTYFREKLGLVPDKGEEAETDKKTVPAAKTTKKGGRK